MHLIQEGLSFYWSLLKSNRRLIFFSLSIFFLGCLLGYLGYLGNPTQVETAIKDYGLLDQLKEFSTAFKSMSTWDKFLSIFTSNLFAASLLILFGTLFSIFPLLMIFSNGVVVGLVSALASKEVPFSTILLGLVPHGIFEIPALVLAGAWGMLLGIHSWRVIVSIFTRQAPEFKMRQYRRTFNEAGFIWLLICVLLIFAAAMEILVTGSLLGV